MTIELARWVVGAVAVYLAAGAAFAVAFVAGGVGRIDAGAAGMPGSVRILIFAGVVALWPLMLLKWLKHQEPPAS